MADHVRERDNWINRIEDVSDRMATVLRSNLRDIKTVNTSGMWSGHPFTQAEKETSDALLEYDARKEATT